MPIFKQKIFKHAIDTTSFIAYDIEVMRIGLHELADRFYTTPEYIASVLYTLLKIDRPIPLSIDWESDSPRLESILAKLRTVFKKEKRMPKEDKAKVEKEAPKKKGPTLISLTDIAKDLSITASDARAIMRRAAKKGDIEHEEKARWEFPQSERAGIEKILKAAKASKAKAVEEKPVKAKPTKKKPVDDEEDDD